jgi:uncharacterized protein (UPF0335 family)
MNVVEMNNVENDVLVQQVEAKSCRISELEKENNNLRGDVKRLEILAENASGLEKRLRHYISRIEKMGARGMRGEFERLHGTIGAAGVGHGQHVPHESLLNDGCVVMSIGILRQRRHRYGIAYIREFEWQSGPGAGFEFDCDKDGKPLPFECETAAGNYRKCMDGTYGVIDKGIRPMSHEWVEPAVGRCVCCTEVPLAGLTNTCTHCGRSYGIDGQLLP